MNDPRIIIALDYPDSSQALTLSRQLDPSRCRLKIGKELFTRTGPVLVEHLTRKGFDIFLDLKFHDIPHTVAKACLSAADLGAWAINIHAFGGLVMMTAAKEALAKISHPPLLIAVTVLTSLDQETLRQLGVAGTPEENVLRLAGLASEAGLDGVVCSGHEASTLRKSLGKQFLLITPGIRPKGTDAGDQRRVLTPKEAVEQGSNYLVIGRPITGAADPMAALESIEGEVKAAK